MSEAGAQTIQLRQKQQSIIFVPLTQVNTSKMSHQIHRLPLESRMDKVRVGRNRGKEDEREGRREGSCECRGLKNVRVTLSQVELTQEHRHGSVRLSVHRHLKC